MLVQFSIIPIGKGPSLSRDVAQVLKIVDKSGLKYKINPMGTVVEGKWDEVMHLIKSCHRSVLKNNERIVTTISIDDRKHKKNRIEDKILSVEKRLNKSLCK
ncbi:MAG: MTH1187 family thiamine-binding protein [Nitrospiraceae bacterium]|nr:MAG: MTH1187 family thiamine-binding protein [Nitrospiraceae bacterium]